MRDWRRRHLVDDIGQETNGRWRYSPIDIVQIACARELAKLPVISLKFAFDLSLAVAMLSIGRMRQDLPRLPLVEVSHMVDDRIVYFWPAAEAGFVRALPARDVDAAFAESGSAALIAIDIDRLVSGLPATVVAFVRNDLVQAKS